MNSSSTGIFLSQAHWDQMEGDVSSRSPEEACGFVLGTGNTSQAVFPVTNALHDPFRFRMEPEEELKAFLLAEEKGWEILAIYHSHPRGIDHPSATDYAELTFPGILYLIWFQLDGKWQCRAYSMLAHTEAIEVPVIISTITNL